ncbi:hypothetical protein, partial [Azospirillum sp. TSH7]|uniref:hypothetical protein n=1 Tax=Azospirillum sp. TSH7 TaxID=652751 RepID=UPI001B3BBC8D
MLIASAPHDLAAKRPGAFQDVGVKAGDRGGGVLAGVVGHLWRDNQDGERDNQDETVWGRGRSMIDA